MSRRLIVLCLWLVAACGRGPRAPDEARGVALPDPFDAAGAGTPSGDLLAFGVRDGAIRNYFSRQGPVAVHLLARSGPAPRLIVAFPAENQGIGVWFSTAPGDTELSAGAQPASDPSPAGGELRPVIFERERDARGVWARLRSNANQLSTALVLLGNVRTLRDYGYGTCLEDAAQFPALRNESIEPGPSPNTLRIRREQIGGASSLELWLAGRSGTTLRLRERTAPARTACPSSGQGSQPVIDIEGNGGIDLELIALADDEPLTPIAARDLLRPASASGAPAPGPDGEPGEAPLELAALAFLSYDEKLLAGSWRFLTYFGRDTLLSLWLLMPALDERVLEAAVGSVLERVQLVAGVPAPDGGEIARGDVAHEEEVGDYAAWRNSQLSSPPVDPRQPRYDYGMVDDDFLLPPLLLALATTLDAASASSPATSPASAPNAASAATFDAFLARRRSDGHTFADAALANLDLVLRRARPFADDPRPFHEKATALVALHDDRHVGQWRDSEMGLAFGRYPFDVNAALVPAALDAAAALYERLAQSERASEARRRRAAWRGVEELFRFELPLEQARASVTSYAGALGLADPSSSLDADATLAPPATGPTSVQYALALDAAGHPLPVIHSDHGFVLAFTDPGDAYLRRVAALLERPFPAGLASPAGVLVANPAFADATLTVTDLRASATTDPAATPLRELFTPAHYHGTVVWSWQQALLARGLRRQLARAELEASTRAALEAAECSLWRMIDATRGGSTRELWSWAPGTDGRPELRPFGAGQDDADESNAIQLWSTVYLAVHPPNRAQNPRCAASSP